MAEPVEEEKEHVVDIPYEDSFLRRLHGFPERSQSLTAHKPWMSAYTGDMLHPYIWRDYETRPWGGAVLDEIEYRGWLVKFNDRIKVAEQSNDVPGSRHNPHPSRQSSASKPSSPQLSSGESDESTENEDDLDTPGTNVTADRDDTMRPPQPPPIDYVYLQRAHVKQANDLLQRMFWPGIDGVFT